jgi:uncharacterized membrane protein YbhN (UPF0104 family)
MDLYLCTAVALSFALFTPLQSGEVVKIELLKKYDLLQRAPGYGTFLVEKSVDLAVLLSMACVSLLTILDILPNRNYAYFILGFLLLGFAFLLALLRIRAIGRLNRFLYSIYVCAGSLKVLAVVILITCLSWAAVAVTWQVFLHAGGISLDFTKTVALLSSVALISIVSLIPGGAGVSEVGLTRVLLHFGFAAVMAQAGALLIRSIDVVSITLGVGHLGLWKLVRFYRKRRLTGAT